MSTQTAKRAFDLCCASLGLLVLLPLGLLIALLVKLSDGGPILFEQVRIGQFGRPFRIRKFRSMVVNAEKIGVPLTKDRDPRITKMGRFLRKSKLDELPQLWNVLSGEMSFVGPRPEVPRYVDLYTEEQRAILRHKPGITDLATLLFRNEEALLSGAKNVEEFYLQYFLPRKIELNQRYARNASLLQDIWVILQTLCPYWGGVLVIYGIALPASFWLACQLHGDFKMNHDDYAMYRRCLPWMVIPQLVLLFWRGQLRSLLSYFSMLELQQTATALAGATALQIACRYLLLPPQSPFSRSLFVIDWLISLFLLSGIRLTFRLLRERSSTERPKELAKEWRVAIVGTGSLATSLALDFTSSARADQRVVAFFDDNPHTWHKRPHGIPVFGMPECLLNPEWLKKLDEVVVALPEENSPRLTQIVEMLRPLPLKVTVASGWPRAQAQKYPMTRQNLLSP